MKHSIRGKYPVEGILKDGTIIKLKNERVTKLPWKSMVSQNGVNGSEYNVKYDIPNEMAIITSLSNKKKVKIYQSINNGDVWSIFVKDEYQRLPVQDKIVIDIGANIGDSPIYFALRGANKVIALEPCIQSYSIAKTNLKSNDLLDKVTLILAGCSASIGSITMHYRNEYDDDISSSQFNNDDTQFSLSYRNKNATENDDDISSIQFNNDRKVVQLLTIKGILHKYKIKNKAVLKMDCEGCEYESILSTPLDTLQRFSHMLIEFHHGYKDLKEKLESSGFIVSVSNPTYKKGGASSKPFQTGYLYATYIRNQCEYG